MVSSRTKFWAVLTLIAVFAGIVSPARAAGSTKPDKYDPSVCDGAGAKDGAALPLSSDCLDMIKAFPKPDVKEIDKDLQTLNAYSFWRVGPAATNTYDSAGGAVTGSIPAGFNFVRAVDLSVDGWLQIQGGKWVNIAESKARIYKPSYFSGVTFTDGLAHDFAWVLDKSNIYASEYPGGPASSATKRVLIRYERVNIYASAKDDKGAVWYMIGPNQWVKHTFLAKVSKIAPPKDTTIKTADNTVKGRWVAVDLYEQTLVAYEDDVPVYATMISSGLPKHETNEGLFKVWAQLPQDSMSGATGAPSAYALQFVPFVMYFDQSISLHGTYWHDLFGYRQSHGCVNMSISDAHYMLNWFAGSTPDKDGAKVNYVYVYSSGTYGNDVIKQ